MTPANHAVTRGQIESRARAVSLRTLAVQNKPGGYMCSSCAWAKPPQPHAAEFCENGAKATLWDLTSTLCTPQFFAEHSVETLQGWSDHELESAGRLTQPLRYDAGQDRYVPVTWEAAIADIAQHLRQIPPRSATFYTSGKASLEASFLYAGSSAMDSAFIDAHTEGKEAFVDFLDSTPWEDIEASCGVPRGELAQAADVYVTSANVIGIYGMG